jgi:glucan phosphorylase
LWETHIRLKKALIEEVKKLATDSQRNSGNVLKITSVLNEKSLIIGFARRFATYKRAFLPFTNLEKLASIVNDSKHPVEFLFAGKAHPSDGPGRDMIKNIIEISKQEKFEGKILFLEDYDIDLAKYLTQGVDVWLNTPEPGKEASGTSGMKAALNGVLNFSVADGWWGEAHLPGNGWTFPLPLDGNSPDIQNELDAEAFYEILEHEIIPTYFKRDESGIPINWISMAKNSISSLAPMYSTRRMMDEYLNKYYTKISQHNKEMQENHFENAKKLAAWKQKVTQGWNGVQVISTEVYDSSNKALPLGSELKPKITLDLDGLTDEDIGVEIVFIEKRKNATDFSKIVFTSDLLPLGKQDNQVTYQCTVPITRSGVYEYGFRIYPKNTLLISKLDFPLVKWV